MSNVTKCKECSGTVSKNLTSCPHCKEPMDGYTCTICRVDGIRKSEMVPWERKKHHQSCYDRVTISFRELCFVHTCEACSKETLINFSTDVSRVSGGYGGIFDLSNLPVLKSVSNDLTLTPCENCGHERYIDTKKINYPSALCNCCELKLNKDHPDTIKITHSFHNHNSNRIEKEYVYVHRLCYQTPKNKADEDEKVRDSLKSALKYQRDVRKENYWNRFDDDRSTVIFKLLGCLILGLILLSTSGLLQFLGAFFIIGSIYQLIKGIGYLF
jgi:hypothetical protein